MFDAPIVQVAVGLIVVFFVFSTLCSGLAELINRALHLRADYLLRGIKSLLNGSGPVQMQVLDFQEAAEGAQRMCQPGELADLLLKLPIIGTLGQQADGDPIVKKNMPSYLPARTFAAGIMDILIPEQDGSTTFDQLITRIEQLPEPARSSLLAIAKNANQSVAQFRQNVARWYDDQMDRVAGWYKRRVRVFIMIFAAIFAIGFNVNIVTLAKSLYTNPDSRQALVAQSDALQQCPADQREQCTQDAAENVVRLGKSTLPLFWQPTRIECVTGAGTAGTAPDCGFFEARDMGSVWGWVLAIIGWLIAAGAFAMGGPFWFDVLGKLASLRGGGERPPKAGEVAPTDGT